MSVTWAPSYDNLAVVGYLVYRNNALVATLATTKWDDSLPLKSGSRTYSVIARDAAGNLSPPATVIANR